MLLQSFTDASTTVHRETWQLTITNGRIDNAFFDLKAAASAAKLRNCSNVILINIFQNPMFFFRLRTVLI
jgi:hypothetical protein